MTNVLIDPTLRRARIVRSALVFLLFATVGVMVPFARGLRGSKHDPPSLPSARKAMAAAARRPPRGRVPNRRH